MRELFPFFVLPTLAVALCISPTSKAKGKLNVELGFHNLQRNLQSQLESFTYIAVALCVPLLLKQKETECRIRVSQSAKKIAESTGGDEPQHKLRTYANSYVCSGSQMCIMRWVFLLQNSIRASKRWNTKGSLYRGMGWVSFSYNWT